MKHTKYCPCVHVNRVSARQSKCILSVSVLTDLIEAENVFIVYGMWKTSFCSPIKHQIYLEQRGRTTNGEIDPFGDHIYEIWNHTISVIWIIRGTVYIYQTFIVNN